MDDLFAKASALLASVRDAPHEEREARMRRAFAEDPALESMFAALCRTEGEGETTLSGRLAEFAALMASIRAAAGSSERGRVEAVPDARDRYEVLEQIGSGGMGSIFEVRDRALRRNLAMKVIRADGPGGDPGTPLGEQIVARFREEAQVTGQLEHPGIVPIHDFGVDSEGRVFFTMRLIKGMSLAEVFESERDENTLRYELRLARGTARLLKVCEAVAFAHSKGVVHRDLKPANVMIGRFGEVYVMDWGLARVLGSRCGEPEEDRSTRPESIVRTDRGDAREQSSRGDDSPFATSAGDVVGTPSYMPPEQARGENERVDVRADVYAVGAMIYELAAGRAPFVSTKERRSAREILSCVLAGPPESLSEIEPRVPAELDAIAQKAMSREIGSRYTSMIDLAEDLRAYLENRVVRAHATGAGVELRKWFARNRTVAWTLLASMILLAGMGTVFTVLMKAERDEARRESQRADRAARLESESRQEAERRFRTSNVLAVQARLDSGDLGSARELMNATVSDADGFVERVLRSRCWSACVSIRAFEKLAGDLVFDPAERWFAVARGNPTSNQRFVKSAFSEVRMFALPDGETIRDLNGLGSDVRDLSISNDGKRLFAGSARRVVSWNPDDGSVKWVVVLDDQGVSSGDLRYLESCPDRLLVVREHGVEWRDPETGAVLRAIRPKGDPIDVPVVGSVSGKWILVEGPNERVSVFDVEGERIVAILEAIHENTVVGAAFVEARGVEDGVALVTEDGSVHLVPMAGEKGGGVLAIESVSSDFDEEQWELLRPRIALDPRLRKLWVGTFAGIVHEVPVFDESVRLRWQPATHPTPTVAASPSGDWLASLDFEGNVHLIDRTATHEVDRFERMRTRFVAFDRREGHLVVGAVRVVRDRKSTTDSRSDLAFVRVYDPASGVCIRQFGPYPTRNGWMAVDADGSIAVLDDESGAHRVVDFEDGSMRPTILSAPEVVLAASILSGSARAILASDESVRLVDVGTGATLANVPLGRGTPIRIVGNGEGKRVALTLSFEEKAPEESRKRTRSIVRVLRTDSLETDWESSPDDGDWFGLSFSRGGESLFMGTRSGELREIEFVPGTVPRIHGSSQMRYGAESACRVDGVVPMLCIGTRDGSIELRDLDSRAVVMELDSITPGRSGLEFFFGLMASGPNDIGAGRGFAPVAQVAFDSKAQRVAWISGGFVGRLPAIQDAAGATTRRQWRARIEAARPVVTDLVRAHPELLAAFAAARALPEVDPVAKLAIEYLLAEQDVAR